MPKAVRERERGDPREEGGDRTRKCRADPAQLVLQDWSVHWSVDFEKSSSAMVISL